MIFLILGMYFYLVVLSFLTGTRKESLTFVSMETFVNKVAESGIITLNLESFLPNDIMVFDLKSFLFMEMILKEKEFRAALQTFDWTSYSQKYVVITCSVDAIIPVWAYMLVASYLQSVALDTIVSNETESQQQFLLRNIEKINTDEYIDKRVVIKGCGENPISESAYAAITFKLKPVVKSIMYGEPCSTVPVYKKKLN